MTYKLEKYPTDLGYPDPGHDEYRLVCLTDRKSKFWQKILGPKKRVVIHFGEWKPDEEKVNKYIEMDKAK